MLRKHEQREKSSRLKNTDVRAPVNTGLEDWYRYFKSKLGKVYIFILGGNIPLGGGNGYCRCDRYIKTRIVEVKNFFNEKSGYFAAMWI